MRAILTLNAGSSSVKFGVYDDAPEPDLLLVGQVERIGGAARLTVKGRGQSTTRDVVAGDQATALARIIDVVRSDLQDLDVVGVGHRIVHGGMAFTHATALTPEVLAALEALTPLAPLHQPHNLAGVRAAQAAFPHAVQIGCFDTGFHRGHPRVNDAFALPRRYYEEGVRRYGFHGVSYDYVTGVIAAQYPELYKGRLVIAHLGNGASMCAVQEGRSVGSTMGFSALDGLPMGTRCGQIDPGVVLYLLQERGLSVADVHRMLYEESGLLGLSGETSDMRDLLASGSKEAEQAIDYYVFRARREVGALSAVLGGIDALVFCGGIGEHAAPIRARICEGLSYLGIDIDAERNMQNARDIGTGATRVMVIPTDEERVIARAVSLALN